MRIALSASTGGSHAAKALLGTCDVIYTTQYDRIDALVEQFSCEVRGIPDQTAATLEWLRSRHPDADFVSFSDLMEARRDDSKPATADWALAATLESQDSAYDDEVKFHYRLLSLRPDGLYVEWSRVLREPSRGNVRGICLELGIPLRRYHEMLDVEPDAVIRLDIEGYDCPAVIDLEYRAAHNGPGVVLLTIDPDSEVAQTLSRLDAEDIDQMVETIKAGAKETRKRAHAAVQSMKKCIGYMRQMEKHVDAVGLTRIGNMLDREASDLERAKNRLAAGHGFFDGEFGG